LLACADSAYIPQTTDELANIDIAITKLFVVLEIFEVLGKAQDFFFFLPWTK
jgi:hypothetical protein